MCKIKESKAAWPSHGDCSTPLMSSSAHAITLPCVIRLYTQVVTSIDPDKTDAIKS